MVKKSFNKLLTILLTLLLLVNNSSFLVYADDDQGSDTTNTTDKVNDNNNQEESSDNDKTLSINEQLEELINKLPNKDDVSSLSEEEYEELQTLLEQIETLAEENGIDLSTYDKYVAFFDDGDAREYVSNVAVNISNATELKKFLESDTDSNGVINTAFSYDTCIEAKKYYPVKTLTIKAAVTFTGNATSSSNSAAIKLTDGGKLTVKGSSGITTTGNTYVFELDSGELNIESGYFKTSDSYSNYPVVYTKGTSSSTVNIKGGYFATNNAANIEKSTNTGTIKLTGGLYSNNQNLSSYLESGYSVVKNTDSSTKATYPYKVVGSSNVVATINGIGYTSLSEAISDASADSTIKLNSDVVISSYITINKNITLDLNGHTITTKVVEADNKAITISSSGSLTIEDSSTNKDGKITNGDSNYNTPIEVKSGGTLEIKSGNISATGNTTGGNCNTIINGGTLKVTGGSVSLTNSSNPAIVSTGTLEISGGTIETTCTTDTKGIAVAANSGNLTITGGTISNKTNTETAGTADDYKSFNAVVIGGASSNVTASITGGEINSIGCTTIYVYSNGTLDISGSPIITNTNGNNAVIYNTGTLNVSGGKYKSGLESAGSIFHNYNGTYTITGGKYNVNRILNNNNQITSGYSLVSNTGDDATEYPYMIGDASANAVASVTINEDVTYYESLSEAINAANSAASASTIKLLKSTELSSDTTISNTNNVILDLNSYTITASKSINVTGNLIISDNSSGANGSITTSSVLNLFNVTSGSLTLNKGNLVNTTTGTLDSESSSVIKANGSDVTININGGSITYGSDSNQYVRGITVTNKSKLNMTSGSITSNTIAKNTNTNGNTIYKYNVGVYGDDKAIINITGGTINANTGTALYIVQDNTSKDGTDNVNVTLGASGTDGPTFTSTSSPTIYVQSYAKLTVNSGSYTRNSSEDLESSINNVLRTETAYVTITGGTFANNGTNSGSNVLLTSGSGGKTTISGGEFETKGDCFVVYNRFYNELTITGGKFKAAGSVQKACIADSYGALEPQNVFISGGLYSKPSIATSRTVDVYVSGYSMQGNDDEDTKTNYPYKVSTNENVVAKVSTPYTSKDDSDKETTYYTNSAYTSLDSAFSNLSDGSIITILKDGETLSSNTTISNSNVTLDLNNHSFTTNKVTISGSLKVTDSCENGNGSINDTNTGSNDWIFEISENGSLNLEKGTLSSKSFTIKNNGGTFTMSGGQLTTSSSLKASALNNDSGTSTITGGTIKGEGNTRAINVAGGSLNISENPEIYNTYENNTGDAVNNIIEVTGGEVNISGGNIHSISSGALGVGNNVTKVTITGGTFTSTTQAAVFVEHENLTTEITGGYFKNGSGVTSAKDVYSGDYYTSSAIIKGGIYAHDITPYSGYEKTELSKNSTDYTNGYRYQVGKLEVASVTTNGNTTTYSSFDDAFNALEDNSTLTLLKDITLSSSKTIEKDNVTLDINGKTLTYSSTKTSSTFVVSENKTFTIKDSVTNSTGGIVLNNTGNGNQNIIKVSSNATLNVESGSLSGTGGSPINSSGTVNIKGGTITSSDANASVYADGGTLNITGGTINNTFNSDASGDTNASKGNCVSASGSSTTVNISDGTLRSTGNKGQALYLTNGASAIVSDNALLIGGGNKSAVYVDQSTLNITGGLFGYDNDCPAIDKASSDTTSKITVSGGRYSTTTKTHNNQFGREIPGITEYIVEGYEEVKDSDGNEDYPYVINSMEQAILIDTDGKETVVGSLKVALNEAKEGYTVKVNKDVVLKDTITITSKNITLDLNGKTVDYTGEGINSVAFKVSDGASFIVTDNSVDAKGTLHSQNAHTIEVSNNDAELIINKGTVSSNWSTVGTKNLTTIGVKGSKDTTSPKASVTITGGTISASGTTGNNVVSLMIYDIAKNTTVNISGGTLYSSNETTLFINENATGTTVNISGGTFEPRSGYAAVNNQTGTVNVTGGDFNILSTSATFMKDVNVSISGGRYSSKVSLNSTNLVYGYEVSEIKDQIYKYEVTSRSVVAKIGDTQYYSISDALDKANAEDTIVLVKDTSESFTVNKKVTLDLNGHELSYTGTAYLDTVITLADNAELIITDNSTDKLGSINGKKARTVILGNNSKLTVNGGIIKGYMNVDSGYNQYNTLILINGKNAEVIVNDGATITTVNQTNDSGNTSSYRDNLIAYGFSNTDNSKVTVNGGTLSSNYYVVYGNGNTGVSNTSVTFTGGHFYSNSQHITYNGFTPVTVTGGYFKTVGNIYSLLSNLGNASLSGGYYSKSQAIDSYKDPTYSKNILKNGYEFVVNDEEATKNEYYYKIAEKASVASINDKNYPTLELAFEAVKDNETIQLLTDFGDDVSITVDKKVTLDLNNHKYTYNSKSLGSAFNVNSELTITDSTISDSTSKGGTLSNLYSYTDLITINDNGKLTVSNVNLSTANGTIIIANKATTTNVSNTNLIKNGSGIVFKMTGNGSGDTSTTATFGENNTLDDQNASADKLFCILDGATLKFTGGTYNLQVSNTQNASMIYLDGANLEISDGKYTANVMGSIITASSTNSSIKISGGEFINNNRTSSTVNGAGSPVEISGGYFRANGSGTNMDISVQTIANIDGYSYNVKLTGGRFYGRGNYSTSTKMYTLDEVASKSNKAVKTLTGLSGDYAPYVYEIGEASVSLTIDGVTYNYGSLNDALSSKATVGSATSNAVIKLLKDIEEDITINKQYITLDTNGHKLDGTLTVSSSDVVLKGSGTTTKINVSSSGSLTIEEGTIDSFVSTGTVNITGGKFKGDPSSYLTGLYTASKEGDYWEVKPVVEVTVSTFDEFKKAMESSSVTKVTLTSDIVMTSSVNTVGTKELVLDKNITVNTVSSRSNPYTINVGDDTNKTNLTISGSGTITTSYKEALHVNSGSTLTLKSGTITSINSNTNNAVMVSGGTLNVEGGEINLAYNTAYGSAYAAVYLDTGTLNVSGGTIQGTANNNRAIYANPKDNTSINITGGNIKSSGAFPDITCTKADAVSVTGGKFGHDFTSVNTSSFLKDSVVNDLGKKETYRYEVLTKYEVEVTTGDTTTKYTSLKEALAASKDNSTVKLLRDSVDLNTIDCEVKANNVTLDLNGYTANINTKPITVSGSLTIKDSSEAKTGNLVAASVLNSSGNTDSNYATNLFDLTGTLNLESGTLTSNASTDSKNIVVNMSGSATLNMNGGSIVSTGWPSYSIYANGENTSVNIKGGSMEPRKVGIYVNQGSLDVDKISMTKGSPAIQLVSAKADFEGSLDDINIKSTSYAIESTSSTVSINNGRYYSTGGQAIMLNGNNNLTILDGYVAGGNTMGAIDCNTTGNDKVFIADGYFYNSNAHMIVNVNGSLTITGGTFLRGNDTNTNLRMVNAKSDQLKIYGGQFSPYQYFSTQLKATSASYTVIKYATDATRTMYLVGPGSSVTNPIISIDSNGSEHKFASIEEALENSTSGSTIKLPSDITLDKTLTIDKDITIDLNGHTLSTKSEGFTDNSAISINKGINLTIKDSSNPSTGKITSDLNIIETNKGSTFTLNGGTLDSNKDNTIIVKGEGTKVSVNSGTINAKESDKNAVYFDSSAKNANVTVNTGTLTSAKSNVVAGGTSGNNNTVIINNGSFSTKDDDGNYNADIFDDSNYTLTINNGKFDSGKETSHGVVGSNSNATIYGGEFSTKTNAEKRLPNKEGGESKYSFKDNTDTDKETYPFVVSSNDDVIATITDSNGSVKEYSSLEDAINEASEGSTITLKKDVEGTSTITINKDVTLDLGGYKISSTGSDPTVTIDGKANVTIKNGEISDSTGSGSEDTNVSIYIKAGSSLTLGNGKDGLTTPSTKVGKIINEGTLDVTIGVTTDAITGKEGSTTDINGGTVKGGDDDQSTSITGEKGSSTNINSGKTGSIETEGSVKVTGGETGKITTTGSGSADITGGNVAGLENNSTNEGGDNISGGNTGDVSTGTGSTTNITGGTISGSITGDGKTNITGGTITGSTKPTVDDKHVVIETTDGGNTTYKVLPKEDAIGVTSGDGTTTYYETLKDAIDNASEGSTVTVNKDTNISEAISISKSITIDLNGKTLKAINENSVFTITGTSAVNVTIKDSSAEGTGSVVGSDGLTKDIPTIDLSSATSESTLTIDKATIKGGNGADNANGNGHNGSSAISAGNNKVVLNNKATVIGGDGGDASGESGNGGSGAEAISKGETGSITKDDESTITVQKGSDGSSGDVAKWKAKYQDIINATTVTDEDLSSELGITNALNAYNDEYNLSDIKTELTNKQTAATWYKDNNTGDDSAIKDTVISLDDTDKINTAYNTLNGESMKDAKKYISEEVIADITNKHTAVEFLNNDTWKESLSKSLDNLEDSDYTKLASAKAAFDNLDKAVQDLISDDVKNLLNNYTKAKASEELEAYKEETIEGLTTKAISAYTSIDALSNLSDEEKTYYKNLIDKNDDSAVIVATNNINTVTLDESTTDVSTALSNAKKAVDNAKTNGIKTIDEIIADATSKNATKITDLRDDAKKSLEDEANNLIDSINSSSLTKDEKESLISEINTAVTNAEASIDTKSSKDDIDSVKSDTLFKLDKIKAIKELKEYAIEKEDSINSLTGLTSDQKAKAIEEIAAEVTSGTNNINAATTSTGISSALDTSKKSIDKIVRTYTKLSEDVDSTYTDTLEDKLDEITSKINDLSSLTEDEKKSYIDKVTSEVEDTINNITSTTDSESKKKLQDECLDSLEDTLDEATLTNDKNKATKAIDEYVSEQTKDLTDEDDKLAKESIKSKAEEVKKSIENASSSEDVIDSYNKGIKDIDDYIETTGKTSDTLIENKIKDAKTTLDDKANQVKNDIDKDSSLTDSQKEIYKAKVDELTDKAKEAITGETLTDINAKLDEGLSSIDSINTLIDTAKDNIKTLKDYADQKKNEIDNLKGLTDGQKDSAKASIDKELANGTYNITKANKSEDITKALDASKTNMDNIVTNYTNISNKAIEAIKSEVDTYASEITKKINALSNLTDDQKNSYISEINSKVESAKTTITNGTSLDSMNSTKDSTKSSLDEIYNKAKLANDKAKAIDDLNSYADAQKAVIDSLTDLGDAGATAMTNIETKVSDAISKINNESTNTSEAVTSEYNKAISEIDSIINGLETSDKSKLIEAKKSEAIKSIEDKATKAKEAIESLDNLTYSQKKTYIDKINDELTKAKEKINKATSLDTINSALSDGSTNIDTIKSNGISASNDVKTLKDYADETNTKIDGLAGLSDEAKKAAKSYIQKEYESGRDNIVSGIDNALDTSKGNMDAIYKRYSEVTSKNTLDNLKKEVSDKAEEIKNKINSLTYPTDKTTYLSDVTSSSSGGQDNIGKATTYDNAVSAKDEAIEDLEDILDEAILAGDKEKAIKDLEAYVAKQTSSLTDGDTKNSINSKLEEIKRTINNSSTSSKVNDNYNKGIKDIDSILESSGSASDDSVIKNKKEAAITDLENIANRAIDEVNSLDGLITSEKNSYISEIKKALEEAKAKINDESTSTITDINNALTDGTNNIGSIAKKAGKASESNLESAKEKAKKAIEDYANSAIATIDTLKDLDSASKQSYIDSINSKKDEANLKIDNETSTDKFTSITDEVKNAIDKIEGSAKLDDIKTGKNNLVDNLNGLKDKDDSRESYKEKIDKTIDDAQNKIDTSNSSTDIDSIVEEARKKANKTAKEARKESKEESGTPSGEVKVADTVYDVKKDTTPAIEILPPSDNEDLVDSVLDSEEIAQIDNQKNYLLWLEVKDVSDTISESDKAEVDNYIKELNVSDSSTTYLDVSLFKALEGEEKTNPTQVTGTGNAVTISMGIPEDAVNDDPTIKRTYIIIRSHKIESTGETITEKITARSISSEAISFETDKFSTYALAYIDTPIIDEDKNSDTSSNKGNQGTAGTCEEVLGNNWTWSSKKNTCIYKVRNTGSK